MKPEILLSGSVLKFGLKPWDIPRSCLVSMWYQLVLYPNLGTGYASPILIYSSKYLQRSLATKCLAISAQESK